MRLLGTILIASAALLSGCEGVSYKAVYVQDFGHYHPLFALDDVVLNGKEPSSMDRGYPFGYEFTDFSYGENTLSFFWLGVELESHIMIDGDFAQVEMNTMATVWEEHSYRVRSLGPTRPADGGTFAIDGESLRLVTMEGLSSDRFLERVRLNGEKPTRIRNWPPYELVWDGLSPGTYTLTYTVWGENFSKSVEIKREGGLLFFLGRHLVSINTEFVETEDDPWQRAYEDDENLDDE